MRMICLSVVRACVNRCSVLFFVTILLSFIQESGSSSKAAVKEEESKSGEESSSDEMQVEDSGPVVVSTNTERSYLLFPIKLDVALDNNTRLKEAFMWTVCCTTTKETYDNGTVRTKYIEFVIFTLSVIVCTLFI